MSAAELLEARRQQLEAELARIEKAVRGVCGGTPAGRDGGPLPLRLQAGCACGRVRAQKQERGARNETKRTETHPPRFSTHPSHHHQIYDAETQYFNAEYSAPGTVTKGLDGFASAKDALRKRDRGDPRDRDAGGRDRDRGGGGGGGGGTRGGFRVEDRLFSLSSTASPATAEAEAAALDALDGGGLAPSRSGKHLASKGLASKGRRSSGWG